MVTAILLLIFVCLLKYLSSKRAKKSALPLPPGPNGRPIIGNLSELPTEQQWLKVTEWAQEYGEILHVSVFGQSLVYLNNYEVAMELLEGRSSIYSDRRVSEMIKLMKGDDILPLMPYGERWRLNRRIAHDGFKSNTAHKFEDTQIKHVCALLRHLLIHPSSFEDHIRHFSSGIILESVYGIQVQHHDDPYVRKLEIALSAVEGIIAGAYLVDMFPILRHLPEWMPGATFKKRTSVWRKYITECLELPFQEARRRITSGIAVPSMTADWMHKIDAIEDKREREKYLHAAQCTTGTALIAGYDTTSSTIVTFVFLMALHPESQTKAQNEIDAVVGRDRLPDFSDKGNLPYVNAIVKEVLRLFPVLPLAVPHLAAVEDEYRGMRIPKGAAVFPNAWAMARDRNVYGLDADDFRPERFLEAELRDPTKIVFGFGRRICPGRYVAENSIFIAFASILRAFNIAKATDKDGNEIPITARWVSGTTVHLEPFECSIEPRSENLAGLIRASEM